MSHSFCWIWRYINLLIIIIRYLVIFSFWSQNIVQTVCIVYFSNSMLSQRPGKYLKWTHEIDPWRCLNLPKCLEFTYNYFTLVFGPNTSLWKHHIIRMRKTYLCYYSHFHLLPLPGCWQYLDSRSHFGRRWC